MVIKTAAMVLLASVLWTPLAAHGVMEPRSSDDSITIEVEVPPRTGSPTPPPSPTATPPASPTPTAAPTPPVTPTPTPPAPSTPSATASPTAASSTTPPADADRPGAAALPATGAQVALWAAALGLVALVAGLAIHARRRSRA